MKHYSFNRLCCYGFKIINLRIFWFKVYSVLKFFRTGKKTNKRKTNRIKSVKKMIQKPVTVYLGPVLLNLILIMTPLLKKVRQNCRTLIVFFN